MLAIHGVIETGIYAEDLEAAARFYATVLGLTEVAREAGRHAFFRAGEAGMLLVFRPESTRRGEPFPAHGATGPGHFALGIAAHEVDAWRERLRGHGVTIEHETTWPRGGRSLYFRDPAGNSVELITPGVWGLPTGW